MNDNQERVLFNTYTRDVDAYIAKGVLETNGVECWITNENFNSIYPLTFNAPDAIQLWIKMSDADLALKIMGQ